MTNSEYIKLKKKLDKILEQVENEALLKGANITSTQFFNALDSLKEKLLEENGFTLEEYQREEMAYLEVKEAKKEGTK